MSSNASARPEQSTDVRQLQNQIESIDAMCQSHLAKIYALSTALLRAMETPEFWQHPDTLVDLVGLLQYTADDLRTYVNGAAEEVGCHCIDEFERARDMRIYAAYRKANGGETRHD